MKKTALLFALLLLAGIIAGCRLTSYASKVLPEEDETYTRSGAEDKNYEINGQTYACIYDHSVRNVFTGREEDHYSIGNTASAVFDAETGELMEFMGIAPFAAIENIEALSDDQIKAAVEERIGDIADLSQYNACSVNRDNTLGTLMSVSVKWYLERDIEIARSLTVILSGHGDLYVLRKTDACPKGNKSIDIDDETRFGLIKSAVEAESGLAVKDAEVKSAVLTVCEGKPALLISADVSFENGAGRIYDRILIYCD